MTLMQELTDANRQKLDVGVHECCESPSILSNNVAKESKEEGTDASCRQTPKAAPSTRKEPYKGRSSPIEAHDVLRCT